jgi:hypothetical protein
MGKDREGKYHPPKGKPSGVAKTEGIVGLQDINSDTINDYLDIAEKYTEGEEQPAANVRVRHPNRNVDKKEERRADKKDNNNDRNTVDKSRTDTNTSDFSSDEPQQEFLRSLSKEQFAYLVNYTADVCISLYIPTSPSGVDKNEQKDTIVFKAVLQQITHQLKQKYFDEDTIERLLKPGYDLLQNDSFWYSMTDGLAVFLSDGHFKYFKMPIAPNSEIVINSSFYISPLIPIITSKDYFYVLVLSKKQAKLYRADAFGMIHIPIAEMPKGVDDVVHFEEKDDQKLFRTGSSGDGGGANFHGIGAGKPDDKKNIALYFDEVDETVWKEILHTENVPLLLAGVEYLIPIYKSVAEYKYIWNDSLTGSYEHEDSNVLYQQARQKLIPYFEQRENKALEIYGNQSATALTSSIAEDVIPAAYYGRVSRLFALKDEHIWGQFDEQKNELTIHDVQQEGDECLVDKAIIKTLLTGGEVYVLTKDRMPANSKIASVMRY